MGSDLRDLLVSAARELLQEGGESLNLRHVASRAGKSPAAPYVAFGPTEDGGGLEALRIAVAASGFEDLAERLHAELGQDPPGARALRRVGRGYFDFAERNSRLFRIMFGPEVAHGVQRQGPDEKHREVRRLLVARQRAHAAIRQALETEQSHGAEIGVDSGTAALAAWAMFHGAAMLLIDRQFDLEQGDRGNANEVVQSFLLSHPVEGLLDAATYFVEARKEKEGTSLTESPNPFADSPALRRLRRNARTVEQASILWVDDRPEWSRTEERTLTELGTTVKRARNTDEALALAGSDFDLIISDIARPNADRAGLDELPRLKAAFSDIPVIFYVGRINPELPAPEGSLGITNRPEELLHLILDVLERQYS